MELLFRRAEPADADELAELINSAYRGDTSRLGWTTEADLLDGRRTSAEEIRALIAADDSLILQCRQHQELLGSVHLQKIADTARIGMLTVKPVNQGLGVGKQLLQIAECEAVRFWAVTRLTMAVIPCRAELIAYYQRRGYRRTGTTMPFPQNPNLWQAKVSGLTLELLEKCL